MRNQLKMQITLFIVVGNTLIVILLIAIGLVVIRSMHHLSTISAMPFKHPLAINNAALNTKIKLERIREVMQEFALSKDLKKANILSAELSLLDRNVKDSFRVVEIGYLGNPEKISNASHLLDEWRNIRLRTIDLAILGQWDKVENLVVTVNKGTFSQLQADVDVIVDDTKQLAEVYEEEPANDAATIISRIVWLFASFATIIVMIGFEMTRCTWFLIRHEDGKLGKPSLPYKIEPFAPGAHS